MNAMLTVPLTITPAAAARLSELDMQAELEQMLERARQMIPEALRLAVILEPAYDTGDEPYLTIQAFLPRSPRWNVRDRMIGGVGKWRRSIRISDGISLS